MTQRSPAPKSGRIFQLEIPCDMLYVKSMRRFLVSVWRLAGIPELPRDELGLAFTEMCNNSIEHGCKVDNQELSGITVRMSLEDETVELLVRDPGTGEWSAEDLSQALSKPNTAPESGSERGMGLYLVRSLMDQVDVTDDGELGTVVRAVKRWRASQ